MMSPNWGSHHEPLFCLKGLWPYVKIFPFCLNFAIIGKNYVIIKNTFRKDGRRMEELSKEEVLHVARLARISISDENTLEKYQYQLKELLDNIDKIKEVKGYDEELMFSPVNHQASLQEDVPGEMLSFQEVKKNTPHMKGNFVEVPVMINE